MNTFEQMYRNHPHADRQHANYYVEATKALAGCVYACTACADACVGESEHLEKLRRCIRTDLDCADICTATLRLIARQTETPSEVLHAQLHACVLACRVCGDECETHGAAHEHCRVCAEACRHCQEACNILLGEISSAGSAEGLDPEESSAFGR